MYEYGFEKFDRAVRELAASSADIKQRLSNAIYHLGVVREENIPEEMRDEFSELDSRIRSGKPESGEGILAATIN